MFTYDQTAGARCSQDRTRGGGPSRFLLYRWAATKEQAAAEEAKAPKSVKVEGKSVTFQAGELSVQKSPGSLMVKGPKDKDWRIPNTDEMPTVLESLQIGRKRGMIPTNL